LVSFPVPAARKGCRAPSEHQLHSCSPVRQTGRGASRQQSRIYDVSTQNPSIIYGLVTTIRTTCTASVRVPMDPRFFRNLPQQARNLLPVARTDFAKAQLRIWIAEFDALAQTAERDAVAMELCSPDPVTIPVPLHRPSDIQDTGQQAVERQQHHRGPAYLAKEARHCDNRFRWA
jgi:hypothetical protein